MKDLVRINNHQVEVPQPKGNGFIHANTKQVTIEDLSQRCIIPVFAKDNESTISHNEFIQTVGQVVESTFSGEVVSQPIIRVSHPIKGRTPQAIGKPADQLDEHEKTIYYERMAFMYEVPGIHDSIMDNRLSLTIGGVRAYNQENLYGRKTPEKFKVFIGFQNQVCLNLCISTDGLVNELRAIDIKQLMEQVYSLISNYNAASEFQALQNLQSLIISESQFAHLLGRIRMYHHMPSNVKKDIPELLLGDSQIGAIVKEYYTDTIFCGDREGNIDLWRLYNLFTGANKSSYIDTFLERGVNALLFIKQIQSAVEGKRQSWYLQS